jgi:tetratricopeptide (TPR) repeat protein
MHKDARGLALTAASADAVRHFDDTIEGYLGFTNDIGDRLKRVFAADPDMPLAHCVKGYFFQLFSNPALDPKADKALAAAKAALTARGGNAREAAHVAALEAWRRGDLDAAVARWEDILLDHPLDVLALRLAQHIHFYRGDSRQLRDSVARVLPLWHDSVPGYGYVLGFYAFGLEESGDYAAAEMIGRRAVELNPGDIWAVHAVAHVMEMQGRACEGIAWIKATQPHWAHCHHFQYHVWWHRCLFHVELEEFDEALALYDRHVRGDASDDYLDMSNGVAMLWRLEAAGIDVGDRWRELAEKSAARIHDHALAFADAHFIMALAEAGRFETAEAMRASVRAAARAGGTTEARVLAEVGVSLCDAIVAYARGDFDQAVDTLLPVRYRLPAIGGSHAQRDLYHQLLLEAALKAGRFRLARALAAERTALKPGSAWSWKRLGAALAGLGDETGRAAALDKARRVLAA